MSTVPIEVVPNHLADPGEHQSLLLVRYGTLTIEVCRPNGRLCVYASRKKPGRGEWTEREMDAESVENARQLARRLVPELGT
jgi:hypothetical protein